MFVLCILLALCYIYSYSIIIVQRTLINTDFLFESSYLFAAYRKKFRPLTTVQRQEPFCTFNSTTADCNNLKNVILLWNVSGVVF